MDAVGGGRDERVRENQATENTVSRTGKAPFIPTQKTVAESKEIFLVAAYRGGMDLEKLSRILGWTRNKIGRALKRANVEVREGLKQR